jgi:hypothetical protein
MFDHISPKVRHFRKSSAFDGAALSREKRATGPRY